MAECADGTNLGETQAKTLAVFWKRKEVQPSKDETSLAVLKKLIENWKQLGNNLQKLIQRFQAEWDWATYWCCALDKEISTLRYLSKSSACARSDVVPCHMPECTSRLLPIWLCLADFALLTWTSRLLLRPTLSLQVVWSSLCCARAGYQQWTCSAFLIWVLWDCIACQWAVPCILCCHMNYMNNKIWLSLLN